MDEFELKFQVPADRAAAVEAAMRRGKVEETRLQARYFDTADGALAARQLVLRLRKEGRRWVQTAKGPGKGSFDRMEHEVPLTGRARPQPDLHRHDGEPVGRCLREALGDDDAPLECVLETDIGRLSRVVHAAGTAIEIALDRGALRARGRSLPVLEIEFELKEGSGAGVVELAGRWCEAHGLWLDPLSKSGAGRRLAAGDGTVPAAKGLPPQLQARSAAGFAAAVLHAGLQQALDNARELAAGTGSDEHVHQLRVGLRRLRTALRELRDLPAIAELRGAVEPALGALFHVLGQHRDLSTLVPRVQRQLAAAGAPELRWQPALPDLGAAVRAPEVQAAWLQVLAAIGQLEAAPQETAGTLKEVRKLVRARLARLHGQLRRAGRHFEALEPEQRHEARKRLKRLRYLAEMAQPLFSRRRIEAYLGELKQVQDALGAYQDHAVAQSLFQAHAKDEPGSFFAAGWLAAREPALVADCAKACRRAAKARPFWD